MWDSVCKNLPTSPSTADGRREGIPGEEFLAHRVPWKEEWSCSRKCWSAAGKCGIVAVESGQVWIHKEMLGLGEVLINEGEVRGHPCWKRERGSGLWQKFIYPALWAAGRNQIPAPPIITKKAKSDRFHKRPFSSPMNDFVHCHRASSSLIFPPLEDEWSFFLWHHHSLSRAPSIIHEQENSGIRKKNLS